MDKSPKKTLYLAEIGGSGSIDDDEINYSSLNVPFMFDIPMNTLDGTVIPTAETTHP